MTTPNTPQHYGDRLPFYVAAQVSPDERATIAAHLRECAACRREYDLWRALPEIFARLDVVPSTAPTAHETWSKLAPRLNENTQSLRRTPTMSANANVPPRPAAPTTRTPRAIRPNTWAAVVVVLVLVVLTGGFFTLFKGHSTPSGAGAQPTPLSHATATVAPIPTVTPTPLPAAQVTQSDATALSQSFLLACDNPATYSYAGQGVPCAKLARGRIPPMKSATNPHYCVDDWHLVSSFLYDTKANLQNFAPQMTIDGAALQTTTIPATMIDPAYSLKYLGGQYYYTQTGAVVSPQRLHVGKHTLHQFDSTGFDRTVTFTIDASNTGACV